MNYNEYLVNKRDYQEVGHMLLLERKHACLFYEPGKGKTYPCVDAIRDIDKEKNGAKVLVLSTTDAIKKMWEVDILPQNILPKNTVLMSFMAAIQDATKSQLMKVKWDVIVIDECHKIKSNNSKISKLVYQLSKKCEYCFGLTGTPRGNNDIDIFNQFHNMNVGEWGTITYTHFVDTCCDIDQKFFGGQMIRVPIGINHRYQAGWERNIAMYTQRVTYDEEDFMPDIVENVIKFDYEPTDEYKKAEDGVVAIADYETTMTKLAAIQKCHQAANGFLYILDEDGNKVTHRFSHNTKIDWLRNNICEEPTVIVYRFEADKQYILEQLENDFTFTEDILDFKAGKYDILLLQCSRCESFNLQMCRRIIFYTLDYSYIKYKQMLHRVYRKGQNEDVQLDILVFDNTIEIKIWNAVKNKKMLADLFMSMKE